jgi:hypothetical protein
MKKPLTVTVFPPADPETSQLVPKAPALIAGPKGSHIHQTRVLTKDELALFSPDRQRGQFKVKIAAGQAAAGQRID